MNQLSQKEEKLIRSLQKKKYRKQQGLFLVEGEKLVKEALKSSYKIKWMVTNQEETSLEVADEMVMHCSDAQMKKISNLHTPPGIIAIVEIPAEVQSVKADLLLVLEKIQDPGNLGTIIRTADAFGVNTIVCSPDTVDCYSPKVVQATMGSIFRIKIVERELTEFLKGQAKTSTLYAAHLEGENIYQSTLKTPATLIMGNESHGISDGILEQIHESVKIPIAGGAESFNVSIATAILLGEFRRQLSWQ